MHAESALVLHIAIAVVLYAASVLGRVLSDERWVEQHWCQTVSEDLPI